MPDRSECPDCGREVAVNKDGSLRKHPCVEAAAEAEPAALVESEQAQPEAEPVPVDVEQAAEPVEQLEPARHPARRTVAGRIACRAHELDKSVPEDNRPEVVDGVGLCGAHYALRPDLRKVARHA